MSIFSYPVEVTADELKTEIGLDLAKEYGAENVRRFMNELNMSVYDGGIYACGDREIKNRIIAAHPDTENAIKRALLIQAEYIHGGGNVGTESGITITADGQKAVVSKDELRSKTLCIDAVNALKSCSTPIVYAGEEE